MQQGNGRNYNQYRSAKQGGFIQFEKHFLCCIAVRVLLKSRAALGGRRHNLAAALSGHMTYTNTIRNICIIGNIASGKSTLAHLLGNTIPNSVTVPEDFAQNPFLPLYLKKRSRWAFTNAVRYYYDYARVYREKTVDRPLDYAFIDAGGATNRFIYGRYLLLEKIMTPREYAFYNQLCELIQAEFAYPDPTAFIFLESAPEKCFERMNKRGRKSQTTTLRLSYLVTIDHYIHMFKTSLRHRHVRQLTLRRDELNFKSADGQQETLALIRPFLEQVPVLQTYAPSL